jgi:hypothetical protein
MINVTVRHDRQIIVPIRFTRAVTGPPQADAPDIDDRGFEMGTRSASWGASNARGAMVGIMLWQTIRVRVLREDIDAGAELFVTSTRPAVVDVVAPPAGTRLPNNGIFQIRGRADRRNQPVSIQVHLGASDGPVLGELEPHVFARRRVRVRVHRCTINGTAVMDGGVAVPAGTTRTRAQINALFNLANAIWQPTGIQFRIVSRGTLDTTLTARPGNIAHPVNQSFQGCVTRDNSGTWYAQFFELVAQNRMRRAVNVYFVPRIYNAQDAAAGNNPFRTPGAAQSFRDAARYGVVFGDNCRNNDLAHELGHVLHLDNHAGPGFGHADDTSAGRQTRDTLWTRRRLMYSQSPLGVAGQPAYMTNVGYGGDTGRLITVKNIDGDDTDGETREANINSRNLP